MTAEHRPEDLLRALAPQVLGMLVRRHGQFDACEDALQEALLAAALQWPAEGVPDRPRSWLLTVAGRSLADHWRGDSARRRRERIAALDPASHELAADPGAGHRATGQDDTLVLLFLCCHPALSPPSQLALTLRAVGGLTTTQIAAAFLVPEATMARRISRAKQHIRDAGARFELMLLADARRAARTGPDGSLVPLAEQRRELWDAAQIAEGQALLTRTLGTVPVGPYQLQAAIAAVHDEAPAADQTDWPQILALYEVLAQVAPGPMVTLSRAVALAMVHGPKAGLALLGTLDADDQMTRTHRLDAVRAHLLEQSGDPAAARECYLRAAKMTASLPEQRYLALRAARLHLPSHLGDPDSI